MLEPVRPDRREGRRVTHVIAALSAAVAIVAAGQRPPPLRAAPAAQAEAWVAQRSGTKQTLRDVGAVDGATVWAVGGEGGQDCVILRTDDSGAHWRPQPCPAPIKLQAMAAVSATDAWAVGVDGGVLHTADGETWTVVNVGTSQALTDVWFADAQHGWITTRNGLVLRTVDGGAAWKSSSSGADLGLFGVFFLDTLRGWVVGSGGTVLRTSDGGASWKKLPPFSDARILAVHFLDENTGFGAGNVLLHSWNGGQDWERKIERPAKTLNDLTFSDAANGWAVGDEGYILHSTDGGNSWPQDSNDSTVSLNAIDFAGPGLGWAVGTEGGIFRWGIPLPTPTPTPSLTRTATRTRPPTVTRTPTATRTATATPTGDWVSIAPGGPLFAGAPGGARPVRLSYGNQPPMSVLTATISGPVRFPDGSTVVTRALEGADGELWLPLATPRDVAPGTTFELRVQHGGRSTSRTGRVPFSALLPALLRADAFPAAPDGPPASTPTPSPSTTPMPATATATPDRATETATPEAPSPQPATPTPADAATPTLEPAPTTTDEPPPPTLTTTPGPTVTRQNGG